MYIWVSIPCVRVQSFVWIDTVGDGKIGSKIERARERMLKEDWDEKESNYGLQWAFVVLWPSLLLRPLYCQHLVIFNLSPFHPYTSYPHKVNQSLLPKPTPPPPPPPHLPLAHPCNLTTTPRPKLLSHQFRFDLSFFFYSSLKIVGFQRIAGNWREKLNSSIL